MIRALFACSHLTRIRERRPLPEAPDLCVPHFVCVDCGDAVPIVVRTIDEHRDVILRGTPILMKADPVPAESAADRARAQRDALTSAQVVPLRRRP